MFALLIAFALFSTAFPAQPTGPHFSLAEDIAPANGLRDDLHARLMGKVHAMNDAGQGIFQDDISVLLTPYFPAGQAFSETRQVIAKMNLGTLQKFKGKPDPAGGTMYVTKFSVMDGMFTDVYVVLNFTFEGQTEADMKVKKATAFIRGSNM